MKCYFSEKYKRIIITNDVTHKLDRKRTLCRFASKSYSKNIFGRSIFFAPKAQKKLNVHMIFFWARF
jgi:hypothetical protein